jgi:hypothetical protein
MIHEHSLSTHPVSSIRQVSSFDPTLASHLTSRADAVCLGHATPWQLMGDVTSPTSAITLHARSLPSNRTHQFVVFMENRRNTSLQATGYLLVQVEDTRPQMILVA